jgi:hypothetical protein
MAEFDGLLDLTGADTSAGQFEAAPSGTYSCSVDDIEIKYVQNDGALPAGTPYLNVRWRVSDEEDDRKGVKVANKCFFQKLFIPPKEHDPQAAAKMKGSLVNFLKAIGYGDEQVNSKKFNLGAELDNIMGSPAAVTVAKKMNDYTEQWDNPVMGVKPVGAASANKAGSLL